MSNMSEYLECLLTGGDTSKLPEPVGVNGKLLLEFVKTGGASEDTVKNALAQLKQTNPELFSGLSNDDVKAIINEMVKVSSESGNKLEKKPDGYYVGSVDVEISADSDNAIEERTDGLYVPKALDFEVSKASDNAIEKKPDGYYVKKNEDVELSQEAGNILEKKSDGYYVGKTGVEISAEKDNQLTTKSDGLYVAKPTHPIATDANNALKTGTDGLFVEDLSGKIGKLDTITVGSFSDLVSALNAVYAVGMKQAYYGTADGKKYMVVETRGGKTLKLDVTAVIVDTSISEFKDVSVTDVKNGQHLIYNSVTKKWENTDFAEGENMLAEAKKYTDDEIKKINGKNAISCEEKPTLKSDGTIEYKKNGKVISTADTDTWFYYFDGVKTVQTIFIDNVEYTLDVTGGADFDEYLKKDHVTNTVNVVDKTKIPDLQALYEIHEKINEAIGLKVNVADIVDGLESEDTEKPLSAHQGKVLKAEIDKKLDTDDIVDNVESTDINKALSANQGKELKKAIDAKIVPWNGLKTYWETFDKSGLANGTPVNFTDEKASYLYDKERDTLLPIANYLLASDVIDDTSTSEGKTFSSKKTKELIDSVNESLNNIKGKANWITDLNDFKGNHIMSGRGTLWNSTTANAPADITGVPYFNVLWNPYNTGGTYGTQIITLIEKNVSYIRTCNADVWGDWKKLVTEDSLKVEYSNPNLLDNPWFTVNQRGQSEYTGAGYTVDRWIHEFDSKNCQSKFAKNNDSITIKQISNNGSNFWNCIMQKMPVETVKNIIGKTVTLSVLHRGKGSTMLHVMKESNSSVIANKIFANNETWEVSSITFTIDTEDVTAFRVYSDVTGQSGYTEIKAVKLELGSISTLANDVAPDYQTELLKCMRYLWKRKGHVSPLPAIAYSSNTVRATINLPVPMTNTPKMITDPSDLSQCAIWLPSGETIVPTSIELAPANVPDVTEVVIVSTLPKSVKVNMPCIQRVNSAMILSAEL